MMKAFTLPLSSSAPSQSLPLSSKEQSTHSSSSPSSATLTSSLSSPRKETVITTASTTTSDPPSSIIIMGAGIAGLCTAHYLLRLSSKPIHITLIDANSPFPFSSSSSSSSSNHENERHTPSQKNGYLLVPSSYKSWMFQPLIWGSDSFLMEWIRKKVENKNSHDAITMDWRILGDIRLWKFGYHFLHQKYNRYKQRQTFDSNSYLQKFMQYSMSSLLDPHDPVLLSLSYNRVARGTIQLMQQEQSGNINAVIKAEDSNGDIGLFCNGLYKELMTRYGKGSRKNNDHVHNGKNLESCLEEKIVGFEVDGDRICAVKTLDKDNQIIIHRADAFIIALGTESTNICNDISVPCPLFPIKGYLLTISSNVDLSCHGKDSNDGNSYNYKLPNMSFASPMGGGKWRISGCVDFMPWPKPSSSRPSSFSSSELDSERIDTLLYSARSLFPDLQLLGASCCYRPVSADDMPLLGPTSKYPNLYLCTGYGSKGWTMGCGSGKLLAQQILCLEKSDGALTIDPLLPSRFD